MFRSLRRSFAGEIDASPFIRRCYSGAAGIYAQRPRAVAFPASAEDVRAAIGFCRDRALPLTARGAGSGMAGNNVGRGLVLDLTRHLNGVLGYDSGTGEVRVQPGLSYDALNEFLQPHGRFLPPNPSSGAFCTLGGMVANNASGMRSVRYGSVAAWLTAAAGVWGSGAAFALRRPGPGPSRAAPDPRGPPPRDGRAVSGDPVVARLERLFLDACPPPPAWIARVVKNSAGLRVWPAWDGERLDAVELLAGSEGTLAVLTDLAFRTAPLPGGRSLLVAALASLEDLAQAVDRVRPLQPSGVEFLDRTFVEPLRAGNAAARAALPAAAEAALFVELEGPDSAAAAALGRAALQRIGGLALPGARLAEGEPEARALWAMRRGASPSLARLHPGRVTLQFVEDCAVAPADLPALLHGLREVFAREALPVVLFGHAGEAHVHANPLFDLHDPDLPARVERVAERVCELVDRLGGTLSGEHGDGLARAAFADRRFGAAAGFFAAVRRVCDPAGILNPGKILPAPHWSTGRDLRHRAPPARSAGAGRMTVAMAARAP
ncbi:MAG: FAD-binding oxidoreductase [Gemmatimonadota bacterium]